MKYDIALDGFDILCARWGLCIEFQEDQLKASSKRGWKKVRIRWNGKQEEQLKLIQLLTDYYNAHVKDMNKAAHSVAPLCQLEQLAVEQEQPKANGAA